MALGIVEVRGGARYIRESSLCVEDPQGRPAMPMEVEYKRPSVAHHADIQISPKYVLQVVARNKAKAPVAAGCLQRPESAIAREYL